MRRFSVVVLRHMDKKKCGRKIFTVTGENYEINQFVNLHEIFHIKSDGSYRFVVLKFCFS
jgi:hypothetical protein